jgi:hypothetical protein
LNASADLAMVYKALLPYLNTKNDIEVLWNSGFWCN